MNDKVVITGIGLVSSLGLSSSSTWKALLSGKCGIRPVEDFDVQGFACTSAAQVSGLGPSESGIHPRDARIMDRHSYMLLKACQDAFRQAVPDNSPVAAEDIGFFAGMGMIDYRIEDLLPSVLKSLDPHGNINYDAFYSGAFREIHPLWPLSMLNNISFCQVAINLGIKGENAVFSPHADSGAMAVIEGVHSLLENKSQLVLAGGVSEKVSPSSLARASLSGILNSDNTSCRPFSDGRTGTILGEGSGIVAMELLSSAKKRHSPCYAAIIGYACVFEKSSTGSSPSPRAISNAMETAIAKAKLKPSDIDLVIAHGDGTHESDRNEIEAVHHTFADTLAGLNVFSSKGALGHLLAGAPTVDIILACHCIRHGIIPAVCNTMTTDKSIMFNLVGNEPLRAVVRRVLINSFSCEGQCVSLVIEKVV